MDAQSLSIRRAWKPVLFFGLFFLLFFQLVSEFIEIIYTFGLLGVEIPPEIGMVLLFFSPLLLLALPRGLPGAVVLGLIVAAGALRAAATLLPPEATLMARGIGTGALFLALPGLWANIRRWEGDPETTGLHMGAGLMGGVAASMLLRALGAGSDLSLLRPALAVLLAAALAAAAWLLERGREENRPETGAARPPARRVKGAGMLLGLACVGWLSVLAMLYFAFASPGVTARWAEADARLVYLLLAAALGVYGWLLSSGQLARVSAQQLVRWNWLFLITGVLAIQMSAPIFPRDPATYPFYQSEPNVWLQIPLYLMLVLSPVLLLDFQVLSRAIRRYEARPRALAGGFALAALFFLIVVFAQVFTTVYDYMPVVGPPMRDRFWLAFLLPGLGFTFTLGSAHEPEQREPRRALAGGLHPLVFPAVLALLLGAVLSSVLTGRPPAQAAGDGGPLRVVTYNLQQGYDADGRRAYEEQMQAIRALDADIVGLQETDTARFSGGNADLVRTIAQGLGMHAYYGPRTVAGTFGVALLSRYPVENPRTFYMFSEGEQTASIEAQISVDGISYHILVTHLGNGGPAIQQEQVLERLVGRENVIAMGDFNFRPDMPQYAMTTEILDDAFVRAGEAPTEGLDPARRIDHMFVSPEVAVRSATYIASPVSDHPGLVVEIGR